MEQIQQNGHGDTTTSLATAKASKARFYIVAMLFLVTAFNYGDRATLAMVAPSMSHDLGLDMVGMGYIFSAFSWAYVIGQIPGGWLLDRFGSKKVYFWSIFIWSFFTLLQGFVHIFHDVSMIVVALFMLRFLVGLAESPSFPGNSRIVSTWFPAQERGTASAIFNSAQYFATVIFAPFMGWLIHQIHWQSVFWVMGSLGIGVAFIWLKVIYVPREHPKANQAEIDYIAAGGALVDIDQQVATQVSAKQPVKKSIQWGDIRFLLSQRMIMGAFLAQYCINALTYFFITWFPVYLVQERHMTILKAGFVAAIPAICGFLGGIIGGVVSDFIIRKTNSVTLGRKIPIIFGMLLSTSMVICNYVGSDVLVIVFMSLAFLGKGIGALGWAVMSDMAPKEMSGLSGGLFNMFGNISGIVTPIAIGYILATTKSFNGALIYVAIHAVLAIFSYLFIVGKIQRVELQPKFYSKN
ncbi:MFS transporter [Acinetobacter sp. MD2]|uniref:MFS transporter n=1 Tax=Acinetobacter sp. MD2 TaxID=2600066 RepID=UPI002D1F1C61|nr:MFS transporter [Acinetobacter sp. MD2]MEB3767739.1 MFS transporter [Acinetobacter sp. MD2]